MDDNSEMDFTALTTTSVPSRVATPPPAPLQEPPAAPEHEAHTPEAPAAPQAPTRRDTPTRAAAAGSGVAGLEEMFGRDGATAKRGPWWERFGIGGKERRRRDAERRLRRQLTQPLPRPVVIAVANTKGSSSKTPTVAGLASALGVERGGVVALDLWLRGNLGERTVSHGSSMSTQDFRDALNVLSAPDARGGDVARYLRYQPSGKFSVLAAPASIVEDDGAGEVALMDASIPAHEVKRMLHVLTRFHQVVIVDTGNNDADEAWRAALEWVDVLVVPVKYHPDHLRQGAQLLETLTDTGYADLASRAIVVASHSAADLAKVKPEVRTGVKEYWTTRGHQVHEITPDPLIATNGVIEWDDLTDPTKAAYRSLGGSVIEAAATAADR